MGEEAQFVAALKNVGDQMTGLTTTIGAQSVAKIIKPFEGNPKEFKDWIKGIEKYGILTNLDVAQYKLVAYQASKGPVSDFLKRHLGANPTQVWKDIKKELTSRFAEVTDHQYALSLLRKVRQKEGESIQVYAERIMALAEDAFDDVTAANEQLIGFFIDGLMNDFMKIKIMRDNPDTLAKAIEVANAEQNLRRRFNLRSGNHTQSFQGTGPEPMEVGHARPSFQCYNCKKHGHKAKDCRLRKASVNSVNQTRNSGRPRPRSEIVCWHCSKKGHFANECWHNKNPIQAGGRPGQTTTAHNQGN